MSQSDQNKSVSRRQVLKSIGVAGAASAVVSGGVAAARTTKRANRTARAATKPAALVAQNAPALDAATRALFAPILAHGRVGDCVVVAVHAVKMGAIPVVLATADGAHFQVDVLRRDEAGANGVRTAGSLTIALHNGGAGNDRTHEAQGLGAMALLDALAAREAEGAALPALLTLSERVQRFPRGVLNVLA